VLDPRERRIGVAPGLPARGRVHAGQQDAAQNAPGGVRTASSRSAPPSSAVFSAATRRITKTLAPRLVSDPVGSSRRASCCGRSSASFRAFSRRRPSMIASRSGSTPLPRPSFPRLALSWSV
jgi:hypothetical protein